MEKQTPPALKKVRVRKGRARDKGLFKKLWKAFLIEHAEKGSDKVAWHCLCDDRMILLYEEEFEVVG